MKRMIQILAIVMVANLALATEWNTCLEYWTRTDPNATWSLQDDSNGQGVYTKTYSSTVAQPTKAQLIAIEADAIAWRANKTQDEEADYDQWTEREKAMLKFIMKQINHLRVQAGGQALTKAEVKAGIKAEM